MRIMSMSQYDNPGFYPDSGFAGRTATTDDAQFEGERARGDAQMDQIRDLIMGDLRRSWDARLATLETRLQMLEDKLDAMRHTVRADHDEHVAQLAAGIDDLGRHVRRLTGR